MRRRDPHRLQLVLARLLRRIPKKPPAPSPRHRVIRKLERGPPNPPNLKENIAAFVRLLAHNPQAPVVWVHAGWDLTGERTVTLMRELPQRHANLYMTVKSDTERRHRAGLFFALHIAFLA